MASSSEATDTAEMRFDNDTILSIINEIQACPLSESERVAHFTVKYSDFVKLHPFLFTKACKPDFEYEKFHYMMKLRDDIERNLRTVEDTSKEVGEKFYDAYMNNNKKVKFSH